MDQEGAKNKKAEGPYLEQDSGQGYPGRDGGLDVGLRQSYMNKVEGPLDYKPEGQRNP